MAATTAATMKGALNDGGPVASRDCHSSKNVSSSSLAKEMSDKLWVNTEIKYRKQKETTSIRKIVYSFVMLEYFSCQAI